MESVTAWAAEDGFWVEPYGLDLIESLAALARRRLPHWTDRIFAGNVMNWRPPLRFDFVCTNLEYAPPPRRCEMVKRMLREYLVLGGHLIVCSYGSSRRSVPKAESVGKYSATGATRSPARPKVSIPTAWSSPAWRGQSHLKPDACSLKPVHSIVSETTRFPASLSVTQ
jgi:hypothetical protein